MLNTFGCGGVSSWGRNGKSESSFNTAVKSHSNSPKESSVELPPISKTGKGPKFSKRPKSGVLCTIWSSTKNTMKQVFRDKM